MTTIPPWVTQNSSPQLILQLHQYDHVFENILSLHYQVGNLGQVNYAASKAGVEGLTRSCAKELAKYVSHIVHIDFGWVTGKLQKGEYRYLYVLLSTLYQPVVP